MKTVNLNIRCTPETKELAKQLAELENRTMSNYIINLIIGDSERKNLGGRKMRKISLDNGRNYMSAAEAMPEIEEKNLWDAVAMAMEEETREAVHNLVAPCTNLEFLEAYLTASSEDLIIG